MDRVLLHVFCVEKTKKVIYSIHGHHANVMVRLLNG